MKPASAPAIIDETGPMQHHTDGTIPSSLD